MRVQSRKKVVVKDILFGGDRILTCIPLVSKNKKKLIEEAKEVSLLRPDVIEWRVDFFESVNDVKSVIDTLLTLSDIIGKIPLIFTLRHWKEGGKSNLHQVKRIEIIKKSLETNCIDLLDIEIDNDMGFIDEIKGIIDKKETKLIFSYHNFEETPGEEFLYNKILEGQRLGADIVKIAVMSQNYGDVLRLLNITYWARNTIDIPLITVSMGKLGVVTRLIGGLFGSDMTYAVGKEASAPGQIAIEDINIVLNILNRNGF